MKPAELLPLKVYLYTLDVELWKEITVKILKFGTRKTIAIIVLKVEKFDVTLH